ncbi:tripartite tricarboxylate transporter substrate binding protein [Ramlibacter henchirensis]|uniref:Tripartite tricarboxylate transporter substrate binding protein n=1 Tax=Ramlibacter henchirensis TaxID=204072 RepID=A0A4Z0C683_9BURK|nr:tripartite tricarboxylate transporter substrate binding protein [Ramlibacter henchirensis]TFZ05609.1 tripartite tricarboxylate transporter substrate binding protein [Ramlibacter henchirensis]
MIKRQALAALLGLALLPFTFGAAAADFPVANKPVKLVVGFPAGGGTDLQARLVAQYLSPLLGVPVIVENRPGAGTMLAATEVARALPDGHTLLYTPASTLSQLPHTLASVKYDTFKDFTPVAQGALGPLVLVVHKSVPANNVRELVAYAKANPGKLNYVSQGVGTPAHIFGQVFSKHAGIEMVHVPYKGANDVAKDFIAGRVHLQFASSSAAVALVKSGEIRMLGAVAPRRSSLFPDLPTMGEQGIAGIDIESWIGFVGPAGMDPKVTTRLSEAIGQALATPKVRDDFRTGGVEAKWLGPQEFAGAIRESYQLWEKALAAINFQKE